MSSIVGAALGSATSLRFTCSRSGCESVAAWALRWRNPKIHTGEYRKTWLACDNHLSLLHDFLAARSFPVEVVTVDDLDS